MRSGVIRVLLVLLIRRDGGGAASDDDFRPIAIPLNEWREVQSARDASQLEPRAPARYWEDALRHSVYLTLVRDKIDQLISKGIYEDPQSEIEDRDLWDKVKRAPFKRTETKEPVMLGDVTIMARGKLMEEHHSFRFTEDDKFKDKCTDDRCMDGVKALWSVKRERHRDPAPFPGQYYYELTFSVVTPKKNKPYEKPARIFTVRESVPETVNETPKENRYYLTAPVQTATARNERAIWFHKNIAPTGRNQGRQHHNSLDRLFSSLFTDDDEELPHPRYKPKQYIPQVFQQYSKVGHVGAPSEHQQKKLNPYGNKPMSYKYSRPIPPPPQMHVQHHYLDIDAIGVVSNPYIQDQRYRHSHNHGKTQRPPVLPTPPNPVLPQKNFSIETTTKLKPNITEETTPQPPQPEHVTPHRSHSKHRPTTVKISYASDHVRPPVYNAPPGVFVTMDKKPFKPMPPLRLVHSSKHHKPSRPTDFRPSPQVLDIQFSEPDPLFDSAFRPITVNYANSNTTEKAVVANSNNHFRKSNTTAKKPPKKQEIIKAQQVTTPSSEIITAHSVEDSDAEWTNVLGAFAKTTPMAADKEKPTLPETTTPLTTPSTSTTSTSTTTTMAPYKKRITTTTTTEAPTTTPKPKKRTRPPPKFKKPEKIKKHKRVTTTTSTTVVPQNLREQDLTPHASSASATAELPASAIASTTTTSTTTTTTQATTTPALTTTTPVQTTTITTTTQPTTTTSTKPTPTQSENIKRNRYRQSTLKYRSTSGKDDKKEDKPRTIVPPTGNFPPRRKGSKFQGNIPSSTPKNTDMQYDEDGREDHIVSPYKSKHTFTTESLTPKPDSTTEKTTTTTAAYEEVANNIYITNGPPDYFQEEESDVISNEGGGEEQESRDHSEFVPSTAAMTIPSEKSNEITETDDETTEVTEEIVATTPTNKSKCKKKKHHNLSKTTVETKPETTEAVSAESETTTITSTTTTTTTESTATPDFFQEIFAGFTFDDSTEESKGNASTAKLEEQESINKEQFMKAEDDIEDFFKAFDEKDKHPDENYEDSYEYDEKEPILDDHETPLHETFLNEDDHIASRDSNDEETYDDYPERPYSLLELMAME